MMGHMIDCNVFIDVNDDKAFDADEVNGSSDAFGRYSFDYQLEGPVQVEPAITVGNKVNCKDGYTNNPLQVSLRTTPEANIASSLTSVARHLAYTVEFGPLSLTDASQRTCEALVPCFPCHVLHPCNEDDERNPDGCMDACVMSGSPLSVFEFDAFNAFYHFKPAASPWLVAQINTAQSVYCAQLVFKCASTELCHNDCDSECGHNVGTLTANQVSDEIFATLADMSLNGFIDLINISSILEFIENASQRLGTSPFNKQEIADYCIGVNLDWYNIFINYLFPQSASLTNRTLGNPAKPFTPPAKPSIPPATPSTPPATPPSTPPATPPSTAQ